MLLKVALRAELVSKRFGQVLALDHVSLEVNPGECVALIGESGSGKTTLLRCFNRLVDPDEGRVLIEGADAAQLDPIALRRRMAQPNGPAEAIATGDPDRGRPEPPARLRQDHRRGAPRGRC